MVGVFHRAAAAVAVGALVLFGAHAAVGVHTRLQSYAAGTFRPKIEVVIKNYYEARRGNVAAIVDNFCALPQIKTITVLYENASVVGTGCPKAVYKKSKASIFERYNGCADVNNYVLTNDDDILIPHWSFNAMVVAAKQNPNSIVGSFGRKGDPAATEPYANPFGGFGENLVLVGAALYPCKFLTGFRNFIHRHAEHSLKHCDDIIFNRWIKFRYAAHTVVAPRWSLRPIRYLNDSSGGLHGSSDAWATTRNNCVQWAWQNVNTTTVHTQ